LEPIQVGAVGMGVNELASKYGGKLCFHGSINTHKALPFGTPRDVHRGVQERIETFKPYGGFTIFLHHTCCPKYPLKISWQYMGLDGNTPGLTGEV
jgi:uroporphyrinogen decarboxylase